MVQPLEAGLERPGVRPPTAAPGIALDHLRQTSHLAWRLDGTWERIHSALREAVRVQVRRNAWPSAAIIDSPSAKTTEQSDPHSFDGDKKINGRKRLLLVDAQGLALKVVVHPAGIHDRAGAK